VIFLSFLTKIPSNTKHATFNFTSESRVICLKMYVKETWLEDVHWIHLTQGRDQWRALVNTVMNLQVPQKAGNFLTN
jgi:hypothetical protein